MAHMYIHHNSITIHSSFLHIFHPSWQAGCTWLILSVTVAAAETAGWGVIHAWTEEETTPRRRNQMKPSVSSAAAMDRSEGPKWQQQRFQRTGGEQNASLQVPCMYGCAYTPQMWHLRGLRGKIIQDNNMCPFCLRFRGNQECLDEAQTWTRVPWWLVLRPFVPVTIQPARFGP